MYFLPYQMFHLFLAMGIAAGSQSSSTKINTTKMNLPGLTKDDKVERK